MDAETGLSGGPQPGHTYPITLGSSFFEDKDGHQSEFCTMRLDFMPASADLAAESELHIEYDTGNAELDVPSTSASAAPVPFRGKFEAAKDDGLDCVAIFDPATSSYRLELIKGQATLRHAPGSLRDRPKRQKTATRAAAAAGPPVGTTGTEAVTAGHGTGTSSGVPEPGEGGGKLGEIADDFFHGGIS